MHRAHRLVSHLVPSHCTPYTVNMATMNGAAAVEQVTIDNWIGGVATRPLGGQYAPLFQPRDATQTGQVALSGREVTHMHMHRRMGEEWGWRGEATGQHWALSRHRSATIAQQRRPTASDTDRVTALTVPLPPSPSLFLPLSSGC